MTEAKTPQQLQTIIDGLADEQKQALSEAARILCTADGSGAGVLPVSEMQRNLILGPGRLRTLASRIDTLADAVEAASVSGSSGATTTTTPDETPNG